MTMVIKIVVISSTALKGFKKAPGYIVDKLDLWIDAVERFGLSEVQKIPGFNDEPLFGKRKGQRSVRLNKAYRAIYSIVKDKTEFVCVEEVTKHDY
jgi:toxin HigB-1